MKNPQFDRGFDIAYNHEFLRFGITLRKQRLVVLL